MAWHDTWNEPPEGERRSYRLTGDGMPRLRDLPGVFWILMINIAVFVLGMDHGIRLWLDQHGSLSVVNLLHLQLWRLVTYQFLHASIDHILWNMFGFWMFGRIVEMQFGTRRFVWLFLLSGIAGGLTECTFNWGLYVTQVMPDVSWLTTPMVGASAGVSGVIVAFATRNPNALLYLFFLVPVRAKWAAIGWAVMTTVLALWSLNPHHGQGSMVAHAAHLGGMAFAFFWTLATTHHLRVHREGYGEAAGGWPSSPEGPQEPKSGAAMRTHPIVGGPNTPGVDAEQERRLDEVLRKVHEQGLDSLSDSERRFLRQMSQRKRDQTGSGDHLRP